MEFLIKNCREVFGEEICGLSRPSAEESEAPIDSYLAWKSKMAAQEKQIKSVRQKHFWMHHPLCSFSSKEEGRYVGGYRNRRGMLGPQTL